jgi:acrylyl-CoA reductase (NADPH)
MAPMPRRVAAWAALARTLNREQLAAITNEIGLSDAIAAGRDILAGQVRGRLVVNVNR